MEMEMEKEIQSLKNEIKNINYKNENDKRIYLVAYTNSGLGFFIGTLFGICLDLPNDFKSSFRICLSCTVFLLPAYIRYKVVKEMVEKDNKKNKKY